MLPFTTSDIIWCIMDKHFFKFKQNIYIGFVYIPANSAYNSEDIFDQIQEQIAKHSKGGKCILIGDMNWYRSKNDDNVKENYDSNSDIYIPHYYSCDVPETRNSLDTRNVNRMEANYLTCVKVQACALPTGEN